MRSVALWMLVVVALTHSACTRGGADAAIRYTASGDRYAEQGKYPEAIIEYQNAARQLPQSGRIRLKLADALLNAGNGPGAFRQYMQAADLMPEDSGAQLKAANLLLIAGQVGESESRVRRALALDPASVDALLLLGNVLAELKQFDAALADIEEALALAPADGRPYTLLGRLHLARGERADAEAALQKAVSLEPASVTARLTLGQYYWTTGHSARAEEEFNAALALEPDGLRTNRALASFYLSSRQPKRAEAHLEAVAREGKDARSRIALADYYVMMGRAEEARQLLTPLAEASPTAGPAGTRLAAIEDAAGRTANARTLVDAVLATTPHYAPAALLKSRLLLLEGRIDEALASAVVASEADPASAATQFVTGMLHLAKRDRPAATDAFTKVLALAPRSVEALVQLSRLSLSDRRADAALGYARKALAVEPRSVDARLASIRAQLLKNDVASAGREVDELRNGIAGLSEVHALAGTVRLIANNRGEARTAFVRALELDSSSVEGLAGLIALDLADRRIGDAIRRIEARLARPGSDEPRLLLLAGRTYQLAGDAVRAEQLLRRATQLDPAGLDAYEQLGKLYASLGRLDAALTEFTAMIRRDPASVSAHTMSGIILQMQGKGSEAQTQYERAIALDGRAAVAANNLAWMYGEGGGSLDTALQLAQSASELLPDRPEVLDTVGWIYYKKNLTTQAVRFFQRSAALDPANPTYAYHLGLAYVSQGETALARRALESALKLGSGFDGAANAATLLRELPKTVAAKNF